MTRITLVGGGKIGATICKFLAASGDYEISLLDVSREQLARIPDQPKIRKQYLDVADVGVLANVLRGHFAVLSAAPYHLTLPVAQAARHAGVHYLDLTEDIASTRAVSALADTARSAFIPQCGLAPGFVSIVANDIAQRFDTLDTLSLRVGALPEYPTNSLSYNLTWSTDGVINEYCEPCIAIVNGQFTQLQPLEQLEEFSLDGVIYESFNTSGGLGSLGHTLYGKVRNLNYQTIRYPGHRSIMKTLLQDLRLAERRNVLKDVLEHAVPATLQDVVLIFVTVSGSRGGRFLQETYANKIYSRTIRGERFSAIQFTTAAAICAVLELLNEGRLPKAGLVRQEQVPLDEFLANRFGRFFCQRAAHTETA